MLLIGAPGVAKDRAAAAALFEKAAAQGHAGALYNLGVMAIEGDGKSPPDFARPPICFVVRRKRATMTAPIPMACCCVTDAASLSISPPPRIG